MPETDRQEMQLPENSTSMARGSSPGSGAAERKLRA
jgi:hypothetical protein